jgi:hypothetical protein
MLIYLQGFPELGSIKPEENTGCGSCMPDDIGPGELTPKMEKAAFLLADLASLYDTARKMGYSKANSREFAKIVFTAVEGQ